MLRIQTLCAVVAVTLAGSLVACGDPESGGAVGDTGVAGAGGEGGGGEGGGGEGGGGEGGGGEGGGGEGGGGEGGEGGNPAVCTEAAPVCDPGCGANEACLFAAGACSCQPVCNSSAPVCNPGCGADELCNTACACEPRGCQPDAPVCPGGGPVDGCAIGEICNATCACEPAPEPPPANLLARPSRSTAVDIAKDDSLVAMVNTDDGTLSLFNVSAAGAESRVARVRTSANAASEPTSVVLHPDGERAFVANRAAGTVSQVVEVGTARARLAAEVPVGAAPIGLALSPSGARLFVTDWVAGTVTVLNTADLSRVRVVEVGGNPFAIAVTNHRAGGDDAQQVLVTQFYGRARPGTDGTVETRDDGRVGIVQVFGVNDAQVADEIELAPLNPCFTGNIGANEVTSACFPNQLYGITLHTANGVTRAYVVSVAASPQGPVSFNHNMQAVVSVIDVDAGAEVPALTRNLNQLIKDQQIDNDGDLTRGRRFLNVANAISFVNRDDAVIGYVSSGASDVVLRVVYGEDNAVAVGSPGAFNIVVGQSPQGIVTRHGGSAAGDAFVANEVSRDLSILSFRDQVQTGTAESTARPAPGTPEDDLLRGKRFFNTGTGIWSNEGWGSCVGCHPMGLSDNVTWSFAAGPRQTIALDGQFASNNPADMRALNWTAIFDETHDFELNTRGVSGGKGAIQAADGTPLVSAMGVPFGALPVAPGVVENHQALNGSLTFITRDALCGNAATCPDWDQIDLYIQQLRSPRGKPAPADAIERGRALFDEGGCTKCHGGAKWTVSRAFYRTQDNDGGEPGVRIFDAIRAFTTPMDPAATLRGLPMDVNQDVTLVAGDDSNGGAPAFKRMACNLRRVGTFGTAGATPEVRADGSPAQGTKGFNPPSLLGLATGAPYLHNGAAATLDDLLVDFPAHTTAGNPNLILSAPQRADLVAFLLSIDESTPTFAIPPNSELCPTDF